MSTHDVDMSEGSYAGRILNLLDNGPARPADEIARILELHVYQVDRLLELLVGQRKVGVDLTGSVVRYRKPAPSDTIPGEEPKE